MITNGRLYLLQITRRIWFRTVLFSILGVLAALVAALLGPYLPDDLPVEIGAEAVDGILTILASSMLAVTTFSLSTMVAALSGATSTVTPRATDLLIQDPTTQNVLATFVGSFLFSLVGIIALSTGFYGEKGRFILFLATILVVTAIVATLLRWIDYLSRFGRVGDTTARVEEAASEAMELRRDYPWLGGLPLTEAPSGLPVASREIGYVRNIDMERLNDIARENSLRIDIASLPGTFVDPSKPLAHVTGKEAPSDEIAGCFAIGPARSFDQDPRFGMSVLAEIASRALSPAVNDPGTAIDVIGRAVRLLSIWAAPPEEEPETLYERVRVPGVTIDELFDDVFAPIVRDGAGMVEVQIRLQKAFAALARTGDARYAPAAKRLSALAMAHAEAGLTVPADLERLRLAVARNEERLSVSAS